MVFKPFEVHLLDSRYAKIRHYNGSIVKCLTYLPDQRTSLYFEPDYLGKGYTHDCDPQTFTYIYNKDSTL